MTESVLQRADDQKSNRLDPPHELLTSGYGDQAATNEGKWLAFAGRDPNQTRQQVDLQAGELLSYVREQNREIDQRQAEINAKLAQLDNQLRHARLKNAGEVSAGLTLEHADEAKSELVPDQGIDLTTWETDEPEPRNQESESSAHPDNPLEELAYVQDEIDVRFNHFHSAHTDPVTYQEFEEVERLVAQFAKQVDEPKTAPNASENQPEIGSEPVESELLEPTNSIDLDATHDHCQDNSEGEADDQTRKFDAFPHMLAQSHLHRMDAPSQLMTGDLESERRLLADRKLELDRRKAVLSRMQEETQALHREALEMRLVTEQLWAKLSDATPPERLTELIAHLRTQLDQLYVQEQAALQEQKQDLLSAQKLLEEKQTSLRDQSKQLQDWFAHQQEDMQARAVEIDAREELLDQREHRMQDEFAKWEAQRRSYEDQLKKMMGKLKLSGVV